MNEKEKHLTTEQIDSLTTGLRFWSDKSAEPQIGEEARRHVATCGTCQKLLSQYQEIDRGLVELRGSSGVGAIREACPAESDLWDLACGTSQAEGTEDLLDHVITCDHCGPRLKNLTDDFQGNLSLEEKGLDASLQSNSIDWQNSLASRLGYLSHRRDEQTVATVQQKKSFGLWPRLVFSAVTIAIIALGLWRVSKPRPEKTVERQLITAYSERRTVEMRIEGAQYSPFVQERGGDQYRSRLSQPLSLLEAEANIARNLKSHPDEPIWLHAQGRADLLERRYEAAVASLEKAKQFASEGSDINVDLATAYFMRAEALSRKNDYGTAIEILGGVLASHPNDAAARFNRAIALERLFLYQDAVNEWQVYLRLDPNSQWADEARSRLSALEDKLRQQKERSDKSLDSPAEFIAALDKVRGQPSEDLDAHSELYQQVAVELWLPASIAGGRADFQTSQTAQRALRALAFLTQTRHQDRWLSDFLFQAHSGRNVTKAIDKLAEASRMNQSADRDRARRSAFEAAELFRREGMPAGEMRARFELIYADQLMHETDDCRREAYSLAKLIRGHAYAWLTIQSLLESAVCSSMSDERALKWTAEARGLAAEHRYNILQIRATTFLASLSWNAGDSVASWKHSFDGLSQYWAGDYPNFRGYNLYSNVEYLAEDEGKWFLQSAVLQEAVQMIRTNPDTVLRAFVQERLSQAMLMSGDLAGAESNFQETQRLFSDSPDGSRKRNLQAETEIGLANLQLGRRDAKGALRRLQRIQARVNEIPDKDISLTFSQSLGLAQLRAGDDEEAAQTLRVALQLAEEELKLVSKERKRLEWTRKNEKTYRALVQLKFVSSPIEALSYWERYKGASLRTREQRVGANVGTTHSASNLDSPAALIGKDTALISYALFDEGTAVWVYDDEGVKSRWLDLPKDRIEALARSFGQLCSDPHSDPVVLRLEAARLYETVFLPVEPFVKGRKNLVIEADGALDLIPFEVLLDREGIYLLDRFSLTFSLGLDYLSVSRQWRGLYNGSRALIVGNPSAPGWPSLPAAEAEATDIAALFAHSQLLIGRAATYEAISKALPQAEVFHFSGHGMTSASAVGPILGDSDLLDVLKLEGLSFRQNRLTVLSACGSAQGSSGMFNDRDSVARLLVADGVPAVVASRWIVDSSATAVLMKNFYSQLLTGKSVGDSVRAAAIDLRGRAGMAHPYYWSGFAVFGRS